jgi:molecular chaperone GrpE
MSQEHQPEQREATAAEEAAVAGAEQSGAAEELPGEPVGTAEAPAAVGEAAVAPEAPAAEEAPDPADLLETPDAPVGEASFADAETTSSSSDADKYLALAQRTQADFDNFRKRAAREQALAGDRGVSRVAKELMPALDGLELALQAVEQDAAHAEIAKGFRLVQSELAKALGRVGIQAFSPEGETFDPTEHEAMTQMAFDGVEPGTVAQVYQPGYRLNGTILRPARVVVAA